MSFDDIPDIAKQVISWLDLHSGSVSALATITLAILTAGYLFFTYRLAQFSFKQTSSDIRLSRVYLFSKLKFIREIYLEKDGIWSVGDLS